MSAAAADDETGGNSAINDVQQPTQRIEEQSLLSMSNNTPADSRHDMYNNTNTDTNCNTTNTINEQQEHRPSWRSSESSSIQKERPAAPLNSTNSTTNNTKSNNNNNNSPQPTIIGAHHINERAPNINRRFFRLAGPGRRERAREERAAARELAEQQQRQQQQQGNNIDVSNRIDNSNRNSNELNESDNSLLLRRPIERTIQTINTGSNRPNLSSSGGGGVSSRNFLSRLGINTTTNNNNEFRGSNNSDTVNLRSSNFTDDGHPPHTNNTNHNTNNDNLISATLVEDTNVILAQVVTDDNNLKPPESEVERIVQRLELRQHNKVSVPMEVKNKFLKLCNDAACKRRLSMNDGEVRYDNEGMNKGDIEEGNGDERSVNSWHSSRSSDSSSSDSSLPTSMESKHGFNPDNLIPQSSESTSPYIHRSDLLQIRNTIRLTVESRSKYQRLQDSIKDKLGFRSHSKVLLHVLNRAVDMIDESLRVKESRRGSNLEASCVSFDASQSLDNMDRTDKRRRRDSFTSFLSNETPTDYEATEEFYYKDFSFYNLKVESNYPWMRNATVFSLVCILAFYIFTPILWCLILNDDNICPRANGDEGNNSGHHVLLTPLYFASATMSTVGYGDVTVLVNKQQNPIFHQVNSYELDIEDALQGALFGGGGRDLTEDTAYIEDETVERWRIFIATLYMILSLIVTVIGFRAGLNTDFRPFRGRLDIFGNRVYQILRDAKVIKGRSDKHEEMVSWMRWAKFSQLAELCFSFLILTLIGMFAVQISLLGEEEMSLSWMESFYWAVQTTTTIGYGDVDTPESLRWFIIFYLAISTYFAGSCFGKLNELSTNLESMQRLFLWEQQEASYTMLADFSGRPDHRDVGGIGEAADELMDVDPEINQFEFTIASLVLLGKITSDDVRPILEKFKKMTNGTNKITSADVGRSSGPNEDDADEDEDDVSNSDEDSHASDDKAPQSPPLRSSSTTGALAVGKQIAKAFREEILSSGTTGTEQYNRVNSILTNEDEDSVPPDYSHFRIPRNTYAIAIDDSKIQRKLLGKFFDFAGISSDFQTIVGDGYDEIMGFEDFVVNFMENHTDDYVFLIADENLDVVNENDEPMTISGSTCVEKIRNRLSPRLERRMFSLIRSANDSSSDINIYSSRAHGFLPKAPIKRDTVVEMLAPLWLDRFPPSEFGESMGLSSSNKGKGSILGIASDDIACTPFDIAKKVEHIESLFESDIHITATHKIHDQMHELKGDLLTLDSEQSVMSIIGDINLILVARSPETIVDRWRSVRDTVNDMVNTLERKFRIPKNTYAIAIDDSKIQRKLLSKFFDFVGVQEEQCTIMGDGSSEILGFEDFVVDFMQNHADDYVFIVVDENLDVVNESTQQHECISGSTCVESIRKRLPEELERRMFAIVRSANDSKRDIETFEQKAHGYLGKAPIRREKVKEVLAPMWIKRFPPSEFPDSIDNDDESLPSVASSSLSDELACSTEDICMKLHEIDAMFRDNLHVTDWRLIHDQLHMLKGDLLTMNTGAARMISSLGMINLLLKGHTMGLRMDADAILMKWQNLRDHIFSITSSIQAGGGKSGRLSRKSVTDTILRRNRKSLASSFLSTTSNGTAGSPSMKRSTSKGSLNQLTDSFVSTTSNVSGLSEVTSKTENISTAPSDNTKSTISGRRTSKRLSANTDKDNISSSFLSVSSQVSALSDSDRHPSDVNLVNLNN